MPGTLLALDVGGRGDDWGILPEAVSTLRERFPTAPIVLRVTEVTSDTMRLAQHAARLRVRALVGAGEPLFDTLRPVLTRPHDIGEDVLDWLSLHGATPSPAVVRLLREILHRGSSFSRLSDLLDTLSESERTARHRFRQDRLAPPSAWHQVARALQSALRIQAEPRTPLLQIAVEHGYSDQSGLSRRLARTFGFTPGAIRGTLGWEWLLHRWVVRSARAKPQASRVD